MGKGTTQTTTPTPPAIPPELRPLVGAGVGSATAGVQQNPITNYLGPHPQAIPGLTPEQQALIDVTTALPSGPRLSPEEQAAAATYAGQVAGGTSGALDAAQRALVPRVAQSAVVQGLGAGGVAEAVSDALARVYLQEQGLQQSAAGGLAQVGAGGEARYRSDLTQAGQAAAVPREVAASQAEATFKDFLRRQGISEELLAPVIGQALVPAGALGSVTRTSGGSPLGK